MPLFYTPKPRQFRYQPRFYDPEKERWEALKQKYADERMLREQLAEADASDHSPATTTTAALNATEDADLAYFERRVREIDNEERAKKRGLTWRDMFRRREMPKFNYQPRFATTEVAEGEEAPMPTPTATPKKRHVKISRRFDIGDSDYLKPMPAGRIMLYALLTCLLLYWILN